jgi:hypothetical protein
MVDILEGTIGENNEPRFRLEPRDSRYGDDRYDKNGQTNTRLHGPGKSLGCMTACDGIDWQLAKSLIVNTTTDLVTVHKIKDPIGKFTGSFMSSPEWTRIYNGTTQLKRYGTIKIVE